MNVEISRRYLEKLYREYNRRMFVVPDPLQFLYNYKNISDREVVGLIASALAYGRVKRILASISIVLERLEPSPAMFLKTVSHGELKILFKDFKHRFTTGEDISNLMFAIKRIIDSYGSLNEWFKSGLSNSDYTVVPAITKFVDRLKSCAPGLEGHILPSPEKGSACKRLNLYLRWMVRRDDVDPGGWTDIPLSKLVAPLDTHMYGIGYGFGFTVRKQADLKTALEITEGFRKFSPEDPTRYDFSLTRFGIRDDLDKSRLFNVTLQE